MIVTTLSFHFVILQERYALKLLKPFFKIHVCLTKVLQQNSESANTRLDTALLASFLHCLTMYVLVLAQRARKKSTVYILSYNNSTIYVPTYSVCHTHYFISCTILFSFSLLYVLCWFFMVIQMAFFNQKASL